MKVINVSDKPFTSQKNGQTYHNYSIRCFIPKVYEDGSKGGTEVTVQLDSRCVEELIKKGTIENIDDLKGREVNCYRSLPCFLTSFEKQYSSVKCDVLVVK